MFTNPMFTFIEKKKTTARISDIAEKYFRKIHRRKMRETNKKVKRITKQVRLQKKEKVIRNRYPHARVTNRKVEMYFSKIVDSFFTSYLSEFTDSFKIIYGIGRRNAIDQSTYADMNAVVAQLIGVYPGLTIPLPDYQEERIKIHQAMAEKLYTNPTIH